MPMSSDHRIILRSGLCRSHFNRRVQSPFGGAILIWKPTVLIPPRVSLDAIIRGKIQRTRSLLPFPSFSKLPTSLSHHQFLYLHLLPIPSFSGEFCQSPFDSWTLDRLIFFVFFFYFFGGSKVVIWLVLC